MKVFQILSRVRVPITLLFFSLLSLLSFSVYMSRVRSGQTPTPSLTPFLYQHLNQPLYTTLRPRRGRAASIFPMKGGLVRMTVSGSPSFFAESRFLAGLGPLHLSLTSGEKISPNLLEIVLREPIYFKKKQVLFYPPQKLALFSNRRGRFVSEELCTVSARLFLGFSLARGRNSVHLSLKSQGCDSEGLRLSFETSSGTIKETQVYFHLFFTFSLLANAFFGLRSLVEGVERFPVQNGQLSEVSILLIGVLGLLQGFFHLGLSTMEYPFSGAEVFFGGSLIFGFFFVVLRVITGTLRARIQAELELDPHFSLRLYLLKLYFWAHVTILGSFYASLRFGGSAWLSRAFVLVLLPQFLANFRSRTRLVAPMGGLVRVYLSLILLGVYSRFYGESFFFSGGRAWAGGEVLAAALVVSCLLVLQETLGGKFFLPKAWRGRSGFQYFVSRETVREKKGLAEMDCIVCLQALELFSDPSAPDKGELSTQANPCPGVEALRVEPLGLPLDPPVAPNRRNPLELPLENPNEAPLFAPENPGWSQAPLNDLLEDLLSENKDKPLMVTPCEHIFHSRCLLEWFQVKFECPVCRKKMPPLF